MLKTTTTTTVISVNFAEPDLDKFSVSVATEPPQYFACHQF